MSSDTTSSVFFLIIIVLLECLNRELENTFTNSIISILFRGLICFHTSNEFTCNCLYLAHCSESIGAAKRAIVLFPELLAYV